MHLTQLNRECLLHLFSFLDKDSRKNLARTCPQLQDVFEDPTLWPLLPAHRSLSICWYSSRVQVCSIEDWLKSAFQRTICSRHESLVNDFLFQVCDRSARLTGCWENTRIVLTKHQHISRRPSAPGPQPHTACSSGTGLHHAWTAIPGGGRNTRTGRRGHRELSGIAQARVRPRGLAFPQ
uniref:F-box domain-containing protein n=1 Tax=Panthera tigris altaica TaxID=74533 RepID=A0A8C9M978_PANTA